MVLTATCSSLGWFTRHRDEGLVKPGKLCTCCSVIRSGPGRPEVSAQQGSAGVRGNAGQVIGDGPKQSGVSRAWVSREPSPTSPITSLVSPEHMLIRSGHSGRGQASA